MCEYKKTFEFFSDLNSELVSQHFVIDYIEGKYFSEYNTVKNILDIDLDQDDIFSNNQDFIKAINEHIENKLEEYQNSEISFKEIPNWLEGVDSRSEFGELIEFVSDFSEGNDCDTKDTLFKNIKNEINEVYQNISVEDRITYSDDDIYKAITAVEIINNNNTCCEYETNEHILLNFKTTLRLLDNLSACNIYRQAFINIFSIFDAVVFDTLKQHFENNTNELEPFFNPNKSKNESLKLGFDEILDFSDIESLHSKMVEIRFEGKYLSNIIRLIDKFIPDFFDAKLTLGEVLEAINRRNLHVHKKGIVDKKYISDVNPYCFSEGDLAFIDKHYLFDIFNMISHFGHKLNEKFHKLNDNKLSWC